MVNEGRPRERGLQRELTAADRDVEDARVSGEEARDRLLAPVMNRVHDRHGDEARKGDAERAVELDEIVPAARDLAEGPGHVVDVVVRCRRPLGTGIERPASTAGDRVTGGVQRDVVSTRGELFGELPAKQLGSAVARGWNADERRGQDSDSHRWDLAARGSPRSLPRGYKRRAAAVSRDEGAVSAASPSDPARLTLWYRRGVAEPVSASSALSVRGLMKGYALGATRLDVLRGLDLEVPAGEM